MNFPSIQVLNFFNNPDCIREFADKLNYKNPYGNFPGSRATPETDYEHSVFMEINAKIIRLLYPDYKVSQNIKWNAQSHFQKIRYEDVEAEIQNTQNPGKGWIHNDAQSKFMAIVYLSKQDNCGTVTYSKKDIVKNEFNSVRVSSKYKNAYYNRDPNLNFDEYYEVFNRELDQYKTECVYNSTYNKLIGFDGATPHGALYNMKPSDERVMFITFFEDILAPYFPVSEMARI